MSRIYTAKDVQMLEAIRNRNFEMVKDLSVDPAIKTLDLFFRDAVIKGSPQIVRYFLDFTNQQIDCNYGAGDRDTALYLAVACGRNDIVEMLVADDRIDVNRVSGRGRTPLWMAAYSGHIVITRTLLAHKDIQVNKVNENGDTPLHAACAHGKKVAAEMLMNDPRVNPELKNRAGLTAYQCATRRRIRHKKLEEMMLTQRN
jgi:ankyrin repeat protein